MKYCGAITTPTQSKTENKSQVKQDAHSSSNTLHSSDSHFKETHKEDYVNNQGILLSKIQSQRINGTMHEDNDDNVSSFSDDSFCTNRTGYSSRFPSAPENAGLSHSASGMNFDVIVRFF